MQLPRLGVGPMSHDIVRTVCEYTIRRRRPVMMIASRNQVDHDGGYVTDTPGLVSLVKGYHGHSVILCRDHCGPYFKDDEVQTHLELAVERCLRTIDSDLAHGFKVIHVDVGRVEDASRYRVADLLIRRAIDIDPTIMVEFGSEDNLGMAGNLDALRRDLSYLEQYRNNVRFVTFPTGTMVKNGQVGSFNTSATLEASKLINAAGFKLKEHNADWLDQDEITWHFSCGVGAMNVAPQLGSLQTSLVLSMAGDDASLEMFRNDVVNGGRWAKWSANATPDEATVLAGHYHFRGDAYTRLLASCDNYRYKALLTKEVFDLLDGYMR